MAGGGISYGGCPCSGIYEPRSVEVKMTVEGERVVLTDVPQGMCPLCTSRVYKADVLEIVEDHMRGGSRGHSAAP